MGLAQLRHRSVTRSRLPDDRVRTVGWRRPVTVADIVLRLPDRVSSRRGWRRPRTTAIMIAVVHAAVGELPGPGLRVAGDAAGGGPPRRSCSDRAHRRSLTGTTNWAMWLTFSLPVAAVRDPADLRARSSGSRPRSSRLGRPGSAGLDDVPPGRLAAGAPRDRRRARSSRSRSRWATTSRPSWSGTTRSSATRSTTSSGVREQPAVRGRVRAGPGRRSWPSTCCSRSALGAFEAL